MIQRDPRSFFIERDWDLLLIFAVFLRSVLCVCGVHFFLEHQAWVCACGWPLARGRYWVIPFVVRTFKRARTNKFINQIPEQQYQRYVPSQCRQEPMVVHTSNLFVHSQQATYIRIILSIFFQTSGSHFQTFQTTTRLSTDYGSLLTGRVHFRLWAVHQASWDELLLAARHWHMLINPIDQSDHISSIIWSN